VRRGQKAAGLEFLLRVQDGWAVNLCKFFFKHSNIRQNNMKQFNKTILAAALMVAAGSANATIAVSSTGLNEMFMTVYDANAVNPDLTVGRTYNLDLHVTYDQLVANAGTALSAFSGAGFNLATDTNWTNFTSTITNPSAVKYLLTVSNENNGTTPTFGVADRLFVTGASLTTPSATDPTVTFSAADLSIDAHAKEINLGLTGTNSSSLIQDIPASPVIGQANTPAGTLASLWAGIKENPTQSYGLATNLFFAGSSMVTVAGARGTTKQVEGVTATDIVNVGQFTLANNALSFAAPGVTPVPLPAAVWMFGAGLMGVLRLNRRKSVAA
jgi:hypothetical protein